MTLPRRIKQTLRPLIPDRVMARYRLQQHSRQVRTNVDVVLADPAQTRRWLAVTPDTYRVRRPPTGSVPYERVPLPLGGAVADASLLVVAADDVAEGDVAAAAGLLSDPELGAGIVAEVAQPSLVARRRVEPPLAPLAIAVRRSVWDEVGGPPPGPNPLPGFLARLRDAGRRLGVIPRPPAGAPIVRADPITKPSVVILSLVPLHDIGGGGRGAQMALELLRRGYHVTFVSLHGTAESVDLGLRYIHPELEQYRLDEFDSDRLTARAGQPAMVIVAVPAEPFLAPVQRLSGAGWFVVYDAIDNWSDPALGGEWYRSDVEETLVAVADGLSASAPDLVERIAAFGATARLVPNGVDAATFGVDETERPDDLPTGAGLVIGYHGSLYGPWIDWEALAAVAAAYPDGMVVVIGDDKTGHPEMPANVSFLGLKPRQTLPGYVQRFNVGLVPFRVTDMTHAASPLKAFEYLASGTPVAGTPLRALEGLNGVFVDADLPTAVAAALAAPPINRDDALSAHSWGARLTELFATVGEELSPASHLGAHIELRPVVHYPRNQRRL
jgi:glycosyltransferase involved in cell wall biosynthesis